MELIKQNFSIKDLENISGIKAHTIRIWEKRYSILTPGRSDTNIREYNRDNLQKLLNIAFLNENGYKISRISKLKEKELCELVKSINASNSDENRSLNDFKIAMINFDEQLFHKSFNKLSEKMNFKEVFRSVLIPLLTDIGILWQTGTINPIHEHFIVELIKQKLYLNIAELKNHKTTVSQKHYVLFLPENEIHDLGILYLNYELLYHNNSTLYLGPSLPISEMNFLLQKNEEITFLTYLTVMPKNPKNFIAEFEKTLCQDKKRELLVFGCKTKELKDYKLPEHIKIFNNINQFTKNL